MPINFNLTPISYKLTPEEMGYTDYAKALHQGIMNFGQEQQSINTPKQLAESLLAQQLSNKMKKTDLKFQPQREQLGLENLRAALQNKNIMNQYLPEEKQLGIQNLRSGLTKQNILNQYLPEKEQASLREMAARSNYYNMGGGSGGVGGKEQNAYVNSVAQDNPNLSAEQIREAANVYAQGGDQLSDGTQLNPISPLTQMHLDRATKSSTTAGLINQGLNANQAEAEIDVLQKKADEGMAPYANTLFDKSPSQIVDTFKTDSESQKRLGQFIGSQALQFEIAQQRIKLANGQPGVTSTQELIHLSKQVIDAKYPHLSAKARQEASNYLTSSLKEALQARNKVGYSPSGLFKIQSKANSQVFEEKSPPGTKWGYLNDPKTNKKVKLAIPENEYNDFLEDGGSQNG